MDTHTEKIEFFFFLVARRTQYRNAVCTKLGSIDYSSEPILAAATQEQIATIKTDWIGNSQVVVLFSQGL
jgi:hypothetical protein